MKPAAFRPPPLTTLQAGRGVAAMMVVLFHASGLFASKEYWNAEILHGFFKFGHAGVEFFFALSGFIMVLVHRRDVGTPQKIRGFAVKRVTRIYPLYWILTIALFSLYMVSEDPRAHLRVSDILLIGGDNQAFVSIAWTLFHEVLFYCVFSLTILDRKIGILTFAVWFAICLLWVARPAPHYAIASINLIFGFGMLAALFERQVPRPLLILSLAIFAFLAVGVEEVYLNLINQEVRGLLYGAVSAIGIAAAVRAESQGSISSLKWTKALGDSSYSLYLVHYPMLAITGQLWLATPLRSLPTWLAFCGIVIAAVIAGFLMHWAVERRLTAVFRAMSLASPR